MLYRKFFLITCNFPLFFPIYSQKHGCKQFFWYLQPETMFMPIYSQEQRLQSKFFLLATYLQPACNLYHKSITFIFCAFFQL